MIRLHSRSYWREQAAVKLPRRTTDRKTDTIKQRRHFASVRRAEAQYAQGLRGVAAQVGRIVRSFAPGPGDPAQSELVKAALAKYAEAIAPWARIEAARMLADVARRDTAVWASLGAAMSRNMRAEIADAPTGEALRKMLHENVHLITSLPLEAAQRVHDLTIRGLSDSTRAKEYAAEILRTGEVTKSRAMLIARTEVARTSSGLVEARSLHVGSEGYIWRTSEDSDVRPEHRKLNGKFIRWDSPPVAGSRGEHAHAGQIYNCRCYPDPVIPDDV